MSIFPTVKNTGNARATREENSKKQEKGRNPNIVNA